MKKLFLLLLLSFAALQMQAQVHHYRIGLDISLNADDKINTRTDMGKNDMYIEKRKDLSSPKLYAISIRKVKNFKSKDYKSFLETELAGSAANSTDEARWTAGNVASLWGLEKTTLGGMSVKYKDYKGIRRLRVFVIENGKDMYVGTIDASAAGNHFNEAIEMFETLKPE